MSEETKNEKKKDFGEGIEVVKDTHAEEKDIEINFGKIFSFFKKGKKEPVTGTEAAAKEGDSGVDLGKLASGIKGMLKGKAETKASGEGEDDVAVNLKSAGMFFKRWGMPLLVVIGLLVSLGLTVNVRLQPEKLPFANEWAANSVYSTIQNDIQGAINTQYPNLPSDKKSQILSEELAAATKGKTYTFKTGQYAGQTIDIQSQIDGTANYIKDFYKDPNGKPYSPDIDPYYWYRYAKNIVETGHIGDEVINGVQWDNHQVAPLGRAIASQDLFFPYFIAYIYKAVRVVDPSAYLFGVQTTLYPALISALTVLLMFLIGRKIAGNAGGFFAAIMGGLHAAYVNRTIHGDNDAIVIFFAILTLWCFVQAIYSRKRIWQAAFGVLAGVSVFVYHLAWGGWSYILAFVLAAAAAALAARLVYDLATNGKITGPAIWKAFRKTLLGRIGISTIALIVSTFVLVGPREFLSVPGMLLGFTTIKIAVTTSYWPNVLTTVAELNPGTFSQVLSQIGTAIFWLAGISALILAAYAAMNFGLIKKYVKDFVPRADKAAYSVFFTTLTALWFVATIYASTKGIRFVLLLAPIVSLGFGITLGFIYKFTLWLNQMIKSKSTMILEGVAYASIALLEYLFLKGRLTGTFTTLFSGAATIIYFLILLLVAGVTVYLAWHIVQKAKGGSFNTGTAIGMLVFIIMTIAVAANGPINNAYNIAKHDIPIMNDAWYNSLMAIKADSQPSAIITSWWDFGHQFKTVADRRVTFDGTTQQYPPAHYVGKLFMTKNETEALGILRMLDCGSTTAFDEVNKVTNNFHVSIDTVALLNTIPTREEAKKVLTGESSLTEEQAKEFNGAYTNFTAAQAEDILNYTHCTPVEGYAIASEDMIGKSGVWGHFGSWDFEKGIIWSMLKNNNSQKSAVDYMMKTFNYTEAKAIQYYNEIRMLKDDNAANNWISPWPSYSGDISSCSLAENNTQVNCNNGLSVNLTTQEAYFQAQQGIVHPVSLVYVDNSNGNPTVVEKQYTTDIMPQQLSVILVPQGNSYYAVVSSPELADSMYTRMFFLGGIGLKDFSLMSHQQGLTGTNVYVYKALWNSTG